MRVVMVCMALVMAACGATAATPYQPPSLRGVTEDTVLAATGKVDAFERLMRGSVTNGGLWFADPACAQTFSTAGKVAPEQFHAFATCLATLRLKSAPRSDPYTDVGVLEYEPGIEIEVRVVDVPREGKRLSWIGFESRRNDGDSLPTLTSALLESLRVAGDPKVVGTTHEHSYAWVKLCLGADGAITGLTPYETDSVAGSRELMGAVAMWQFKASPVGPACSMVELGHQSRHPMLPMPPATDDGSIMVPNTAVHRIAGATLLVPDDDTKRAIHAAGITRLAGVFEVCLDVEGKVTHVVPVRSTGFVHYDYGIVQIIKAQWRYAPYVEEGKAVPVCAKVQFLYSQQ